MLRVNLILAGVPAGLVVGTAVWMSGGGAQANVDKLAPLTTQVAALKAPPPSHAEMRPAVFADLQASPIFALSVGPGAVKEPSVRLDGVALSPRRTAALLSIEGRPSEWLSLGESRDGVTVQQIRASSVLIDTVFGAKEVALGEQSAPDVVATEPPSPQPQAARGPDGVPPGFRSPPPPASAPK